MDLKELEEAIRHYKRKGFVYEADQLPALVGAAEKWLAASRGDPEAIKDLGGEEVETLKNPYNHRVPVSAPGVYRVFGPLGGDET